LQQADVTTRSACIDFTADRVDQDSTTGGVRLDIAVHVLCDDVAARGVQGRGSDGVCQLTFPPPVER
jgi:hypothetical protein